MKIDLMLADYAEKAGSVRSEFDARRVHFALIPNDLGTERLIKSAIIDALFEGRILAYDNRREISCAVDRLLPCKQTR